MYDIVVQHVMLGCVFTRKCTNAVIIIRKNSEKNLHEPIKKKCTKAGKWGTINAVRRISLQQLNGDAGVYALIRKSDDPSS